MKRIESALRLRPFSHQPGIRIILPSSQLRLQIFPALVKIDDLSENVCRSLGQFTLDFGGMIKDFTVIQDLERGCIKVMGNAPVGYFRYRLQASGHSTFHFIWERKPDQAKLTPIQAVEETPLPSLHSYPRLSLGVAKSPDWTMVERRLTLAEVLPYWHRLGMTLPQSDQESEMLAPAKQAIDARNPQEVAKQLSDTFCTSFEGLLSPTYDNPWHLGTSPVPCKTSPLSLLTDGSRLIQRMIIDASPESIAILPCCPVEFHCGRFTGISLPGMGNVDLEWSKKTIRRLVFEPTFSGSQRFQFSNQIKQFRMRNSLAGTGRSIQAGKAVDFSAGESYFFDRFE